MSRFLRQATEAGVIAPRSGPSPAPPRRHLTLARLVGASGMVASTVLLFWLLTDDSFRVTEAQVSFEGLAHADEATVRAQLRSLDRSPNVFRIRASAIVSRLQDLPEIRSARAFVTLPAAVSVHVEEREPIFIWSDGQQAWLVDREGMLFAPAPAAPEADDSQAGAPQAASAEIGDREAVTPEAAEAQPTTPEPAAPEPAAPEPGSSVVAVSADLPTVDDGRLVDEPPTMGSRLPLADLAVMRQLLALTPELLDSRAEELWLRVDQLDGYVLASDRGWQAVFGHYTPSLQPPEVVPRQVQCLRWLLASRERELERVRLAVTDDECGTFTEVGGRD